ncbi:hypothetical protein MLD38_025138 [Melastoma candidum]|uniref:Uncharacterized protein n=1 Tax=Melastoma candidum TaxID=119954 RepID=A0ACB9NUJ3_9MYRT|nr:hypothetical protein MLD38_025138 [Melastoma candidum]
MARFIEGLFFYSAFMDCLDTCLANNGEKNMVSEKCLFSGVINMLSMEGEERTIRNVKIDVWLHEAGNGGGRLERVLAVSWETGGSAVPVRELLHARARWEMPHNRMEGHALPLCFCLEVPVTGKKRTTITMGL